MLKSIEIPYCVKKKTKKNRCLKSINNVNISYICSVQLILPAISVCSKSNYPSSKTHPVTCPYHVPKNHVTIIGKTQCFRMLVQALQQGYPLPVQSTSNTQLVVLSTIIVVGLSDNLVCYIVNYYAFKNVVRVAWY